MDPLALFPLDDECLWVLLLNVDVGNDEELVVDEDPVEALDVGPDVVLELLPLMLLLGLETICVGLLLDGNEEGGVCDGRA